MESLIRVLIVEQMDEILHGEGVSVTYTDSGPIAKLQPDFTVNRWISFKEPMKNDEFRHFVIQVDGDKQISPLMIRISNKQPITNPAEYEVIASDVIKEEVYNTRQLNICNLMRNPVMNLHYHNNILFVTDNKKVKALVFPKMSLQDLQPIYVYLYLGEQMIKAKIVKSFMKQVDLKNDIESLFSDNECNEIKKKLLDVEEKVCKDINDYVNFMHEAAPMKRVELRRVKKPEITIGNYFWNETLMIQNEDSAHSVEITIMVYEHKVSYNKNIVYQEKAILKNEIFSLKLYKPEFIHNFFNGFNVKTHLDKSETVYIPVEPMVFHIDIIQSNMSNHRSTLKLYRIKETCTDRHLLFEKTKDIFARGSFAYIANNNHATRNKRNLVETTKVYLDHTSNKDRQIEVINLLEKSDIFYSIMVNTILDKYGKLADSDHYNIVAVRICRLGGDPFTKVIISTEPYTILEYYTYMYQLSLCLKVIHDKNYVFRDYKPDNILWDGYNCRLVDYGSIQDEYTGDNGRTYTNSELRNGITWKYVPPEAVNHLSPETHYKKSFDIYSLGITFKELLNRKMIPSNESSSEGCYKPPPKFNISNDSNIKEIQKVIKNTSNLINLCLETMPENRAEIDYIHKSLKKIRKMAEDEQNEKVESNMKTKRKHR